LYKSCDYVSNLCVHVDSGAAFPVAILFPHEANLRHEISTATDPAFAQLKQADFATLCSNASVQRLVLDACNDVGKKNGLKGPEVLCGVVLTPEEWTPETGLVSAAMKVKRSTVASTFEREIKVCLN
jgi:long-chain acyl-CoA synthetase